MMGNGSDEERDDDLSDSQRNEYKQLSYKLFQFRTYKLRSSNGDFGCPFCNLNEKRENRYIHLLLHAIRVAETSESGKHVANHFAMARYLAIDLHHEVEAEADQISKGEKDAADNVLRLERELDAKREEINNLITSNDELQGARAELMMVLDDKQREKEALDKYKASELERKITEMNDLITKERSSNDELQRVAAEAIKMEKEALNKVRESERKISDMRNALITKERTNNDDLQRVRRELMKRESEALDKARDLEKKKNEMISDKMNALITKERSSNDELQRVCNKLSKEKVENNLKKEKEELDRAYWSLLAREQKCNAELQEARKELQKVINDSQRGNNCGIGIKQMGKIDVEVLKRVCSKKFRAEEAETGVVALCSSWQNKLKDLEWNPFHIVKDDNGNIKRVVKEEDESLRSFKQSWGDEAYSAVVTALEELHEYNPSGRCVVPELWNFDENRQAKLDEIIRCLFTTTRNGVRKRSFK